MSYRIATSDINKKLVPWFLREHRFMEDEEAIARLSAVMIERECFFVPFNDYLSKVHGLAAVTAFSEFYKAGKCTLTGSMVMPLRTVSGDLLGYLKNNPKAIDKYNYPEKRGFDKNKYLQTTKQAYAKGFQEGYMCIVEGVYDEMAVSSLGIPCTSLAGSSLGFNKKMLLDFFNTKLIISDNDKAGKTLFAECKKLFTGKVIAVKVPEKDVDKYLRVEDNARNLVSVIQKHKNDGFPYQVIEV